jgi:LacI family transcriptional regulator
VGMDDTDIAEVANPSLTSVDLGAAQRARQAAELLLARLAEPDHPCRRVVIPPRLTIRHSSVVDPAPGNRSVGKRRR